MKYLRGIAISLLLVSSASVLAQNNCMNLNGCEKKACEVNQELLIAKQQGNDHKVAGLDKALKSINSHCSHEGLITELQQKIDKTSIEIEEYKADINKAKQQGKFDKIEKYQQKLNEKTKQLQLLTNELNSLNKANSV